jgi:hypothetical protein
MAAGLGYKEFTTGDVLTAADANGYLASQVVMVFADAAARTSGIASPQEGMISYLKDTNSTEYYSGSAWAAIGGGGGGKVLQVVQASYTTETTISTTALTDTGLSASITPSAASSKILVIVSQSYHNQATSGTNLGSGLNLYRGATAIQSMQQFAQGYLQLDGTTNAKQLSGYTNLTYLDSPSTTSSTTYKTQGSVWETAGTKSVKFQWSTSPSTITLIEIGA